MIEKIVVCIAVFVLLFGGAALCMAFVVARAYGA